MMQMETREEFIMAVSRKYKQEKTTKKRTATSSLRRKVIRSKDGLHWEYIITPILL